MHDVIIIGAGAAGLSAARWCDELGLDALVLEADAEVGGQLLRVYNPIENYLGVRAEDGRALRDLFAAQTEGAEFDLWTQVEIARVDLAAKRVRLQSGEELQAIFLVIATGVRRRTLDVPGEAEFAGRGVLASGVRDRDSVAGEDVCVVAYVRLLDLADEDGVVAAFIGVLQAAFEGGECAGQQGRAVQPCGVADAGKLLRLARGEQARQLLLIGGEDVDDEDAAGLKGVVDKCAAVYADEHERRVERERAEGADGDAVRPPCGVACGHDRHAAGKAAERRAEMAWINRHELRLRKFLCL